MIFQMNIIMLRVKFIGGDLPMKVIIKPRGYGKTTELILISARIGKPILVATESMKRYIKSKAKDM